MDIQALDNLYIAKQRISNYLYETPIVDSDTLNNFLKSEIYFKVDSLQKTGAFKVRGVLNHLLDLKEKNQLPKKVVTYSTGNHGIGLAWVANLLNIHARIYLPNNTSPIKQKTVIDYGGEVIYTKTRKDAQDLAKKDSTDNGFYYLHPSDSDTTIAGAGTLCYEALTQLKFKPDAIFASCGGGGLLSGTYLAKEALSPNSILIGCEPLTANDAFLSRKQNSIFSFMDSPKTIADGLRTLSISERTFRYIKKLDNLMLADEESIYYWSAWLMHLLKIICEPSCALNMTCVYNWLKENNYQNKKILVLISGGNIDPILYKEIWRDNYLLKAPIL